MCYSKWCHFITSHYCVCLAIFWNWFRLIVTLKVRAFFSKYNVVEASSEIWYILEKSKFTLCPEHWNIICNMFWWAYTYSTPLHTHTQTVEQAHNILCSKTDKVTDRLFKLLIFSEFLFFLVWFIDNLWQQKSHYPLIIISTHCLLKSRLWYCINIPWLEL